MIIKIAVLLVVMYFINYCINRKKITNNNKKQNLLKIHSAKRILDDEEIYNLLHGIENYYYYNQQAYIDLIKYIELFLEIVHVISIDPQFSTNLYGNLSELKIEIMNTLISFEILLPNNYNMNNIVDNLNTILDSYLREIYEIHEEYIKSNGMNYTMKLIDSTNIYAFNIDKNILDPKKNIYFNRF